MRKELFFYDFVLVSLTLFLGYDLFIAEPTPLTLCWPLIGVYYCWRRGQMVDLLKTWDEKTKQEDNS